MAAPRPRSEPLLLVGATAGLAAGGLARIAGSATGAEVAWTATTAAALVPALWWIGAAWRRRRLGVDVIAVLALVGTLAVGEPLAGAVIAVMLGTGRVLEAHASRRAARELTALLSRAPHVVHRYENGALTSPPLATVRPGDLLLVRPGEIVPVDGRVEGRVAVLDESALTGEPQPVERWAGDAVRSGVVNAGGPFDLRATTSESDSTYAGIVRLVREAQAQSAPFVRVADRWALTFVPLTLLAAGVAWAVSGDAVRAVAVLVVATPCPLILAAPVAIASGLSLAARRGVIVKGGGALEQLAGAEVLLLDKTGTLTTGRPAVSDVVVTADLPSEEVLRLAASLDQLSPHVLAAAVVRAASERALSLALPRDVVEVQGAGIRGRVEDHDVAVGKASWVSTASPSWAHAVRRRAALDGSLTVFVAVDGAPVGALLLEDTVRADSARTLLRLRRAGIRRVTMVTGDHPDVAETVGAALGVDEVLAECTPAEKVEAVRRAGREATTVMVGDGINDAPALAAADVGVAIGARGTSASSEAADVVLTGERLDRLADAIAIARRSRRIALQSVAAGMGMSVIAMGFAALGLLPPTAGALVQEVIDAAVILNALRAVVDRRREPRLVGEDAALGRRFRAEHRQLRPRVEELRAVADELGTVPPEEALALVRSVHGFLVDELNPHEEAEDTELYPVLARVLGGTNPTGTMSRAHVEIAHLVRRLGRLLEDIGSDVPDGEDLRDLRRLLYGLYAVLRLHFAQEDEEYLSLTEDEEMTPSLSAAAE